MAEADKIEISYIRIYRDAAGEWRWSAIAHNGEIVAVGESHPRRADAIRAAHGVHGSTVEIRG